MSTEPELLVALSLIPYGNRHRPDVTIKKPVGCETLATLSVEEGPVRRGVGGEPRHVRLVVRFQVPDGMELVPGDFRTRIAIRESNRESALHWSPGVTFESEAWAWFTWAVEQADGLGLSRGPVSDPADADGWSSDELRDALGRVHDG